MDYTSPNKQALIEALLAKSALVDKILKEKCVDLFLFNKYILQAEEGSGKVKLSSFHKELCHFIQDNKDKKKLALLPRGHLKSTLITVGYCLQRIVEQPNIRILILNATTQMAVDFLSEIKKQLTQNETLIRVYGTPDKPWIADNPLEWSQERITLNVPDRFGKKEPTVFASGIDSNLVSQHYDLIIMDDVVNRENTGTRDQIDKVILKYKDALDLLEPRGELIVIGTRWNFDDLYGWIQDPHQDIRKGFKMMVEQAYKGDLWNDPFILWPEKYNARDLQDLYKQKGSYEFSCQYMNDPISMEDAKFKRDWFKYYQKDDLRGKTMNRYLLIDPAFEVRKDSDYTALASVGVDDENNFYLLDVIRERMLPHQIIDLMFSLYEQYHYSGIGIEDVTFGKTLAYHLNDEMHKRKKYLPIVKLKPGDRSKDARIMGLSPLYQAGKIFHCRETRGIQYLEDELLRYPRSAHDDTIDAFAYALDMVVPPKQKRDGRWRHRYLY